jgi:hypothetical protein
METDGDGHSYEHEKKAGSDSLNPRSMPRE